MTPKRDMVIRVIGDVLNVGIAVGVALAASHPAWAALTAVVSVLKLAQKAFFTIETPQADTVNLKAVGK